MNISTTIRFVCFTILLLATQFLAAAHNGFTDAEAEAIQAFLRENFGNTNAGMVIGLVDERGSRVLGAGKLDNGTPQEVNGDTVFEIGSVTKTFTTLLLQDMVERDEVKLDDPVAKYLPESVIKFDLDQKTHTLRITKVYPKSSAGQAGLSSGLIIQTINDVPTAGKSTAECFRLLRADSSPKVRLELVNPERKQTNTVELTRGKFLTSG